MHSPMFQRRDLLDWEMLSPAVELQCEVGARSGSAETLAGGGPSRWLSAQGVRVPKCAFLGF